MDGGACFGPVFGRCAPERSLEARRRLFASAGVKFPFADFETAVLGAVGALLGRGLKTYAAICARRRLAEEARAASCASEGVVSRERA